MYILDILKESDEKNPITTNKILEKLKCYDIQAERKSILRDIEILIDYGIDIILHNDNKKGYYIGSRDFEDWEIKIIIDSVASAKFITEKQSKSLINKLKNLSSLSGKKAISSLTIINSNYRTDNKTVKISIDSIIKAVSKNKQISFKYFDYNLSKMSNVRILNSNSKEVKEILGENSDMLLQQYVDKNLYMYGGDFIRLKVKCPQYMADILIRQFGKINISNIDDTSFTATMDVTDGYGLYF